DGITPHLAVVLIGDDASSHAYVRQKELKMQQIGGIVTTHRFQSDFTQEKLVTLIEELNKDATVHGIIIQRPLPPHIDKDLISTITAQEKDVDGFKTDSPFAPPVALAVWRILKEIHAQSNTDDQFETWLKNNKIALIGKGVTAGQPIIHFLTKRHIPFTVISSQTDNREDLIRKATIIISAVGKPHVITPEMISPGVILIGVGMFKGDDGKMHADYEEEETEPKASFYTPVPGGVGPVNVAMLLSNVIKAAESL
ncbi:MAG TPA: bifunctional 5,10-methylenetetrahydrofolate dehydrogenase/5,10-methenyltetrahydrofolate cyclohydrolase, partial [Patescibacteria group bacterium]|nr:bifunctional 5,10-methylenetetrahydrofolate dehydrogenase/5,10-methenyltetrahydrofolate cyclohydrolase [Patescibacteria group bacterium]